MQPHTVSSLFLRGLNLNLIYTRVMLTFLSQMQTRKMEMKLRLIVPNNLQLLNPQYEVHRDHSYLRGPIPSLKNVKRSFIVNNLETNPDLACSKSKRQILARTKTIHLSLNKTAVIHKVLIDMSLMAVSPSKLRCTGCSTSGLQSVSRETARSSIRYSIFSVSSFATNSTTKLCGSS